MRTLNTLVIIAAFMFCVSAQSFAAGVDLTGIGARAMSMGGNYRAIANDWSAMFWNPAGLVQTKGFSGGFSLELVKPQVGYTPYPSLAGQQFSATTNSEIENNTKTFLVPSGGIYYSTNSYAFGVGFWAPFGLGAEWDLLNTATYNSSYPQVDWEDDLMVLDIHPTVAIKLSNSFSIGVGASFLLADIMIRKPQFTPNPYIYNQDLQTASSIFKLSPQTQTALSSPYDHMISETLLDGNGTGWGANFGFMFKPTKTFSIGGSVQYYSDVPLEGTVDAMSYFANHPVAQSVVENNLKPTFDNMYAGGMLSPEEYFILTNYYSGATNKLASNKDIQADLPLPTKAGIGIAYSGISNLLISADVAWTQWSVWDVIDINDTSGEKYSELVQKWEDGVRMGVGLEYSLSLLKLRGAYYSEPQAAVSSTMNPAIPDAGRRNVFLIGFQVPIGPLKFHASYEKMFIGDADVQNWNLIPDGTGYDNLAGKYNMDVDNMMFGVDYPF